MKRSLAISFAIVVTLTILTMGQPLYAQRVRTQPTPIPRTLPAPAPPAACCAITAINTSTGVVTAKVNATGNIFQFKVSDSALLNSLKVGQAVYANFTSNQVSLDGNTACCAIITPPAPPQPAPPAGGAPPLAANKPATNLASAPRAAPMTPAPNPVQAPQRVLTPTVTAPAAKPAPAPPPPAGSSANSPASPSNATPPTGAMAQPSDAKNTAIVRAPVQPSPCCEVTTIDSHTSIGTAKENANGSTFEFQVTKPELLAQIQPGTRIYANFRARAVSLDDITPCGTILDPKSTPTNRGVTAVLAPPAAAPAVAPSKAAPLLAGAIPVAVHLIGSVSLAQASVLGGRSVSGTVTLNGQPTGEPVVLTLKSSDPAATVVPSQISVPAGEMTSQFTVNTTPVAANPDVSPQGIPVSIAASTATGSARGGALTPANLVVMTPTLSGIRLLEGVHPVPTGPSGFKSGCTGTPQFQVVGRDQVTACVQLDGPAPKGGITIAVANDNANLLGTNFPPSVTIPEGSRSAAFVFSTATVSTPTPVHISASRSPKNYTDVTLTLELPPTLTSVELDLNSEGHVPNYPDVITTDTTDTYVNAYLTFSFPPDTSQGDPGTADLSLSGGGGLGYPGTPCSPPQSCPQTLTVSVAGSSRVLVVAGLHYVKKLNYAASIPYYYYSATATLTATYRGTTLSSATYTYNQ